MASGSNAHPNTTTGTAQYAQRCAQKGRWMHTDVGADREAIGGRRKAAVGRYICVMRVGDSCVVVWCVGTGGSKEERFKEGEAQEDREDGRNGVKSK